MAANKGHEKTIKIGANAIGEVLNARVRGTQKVVETSNVMTGWETYQVTTRGFTMGGSFWYDEDDTQQNTLRTAFLSGGTSATVSDLRVEAHLQSGDSTPGYFTGAIILTSYELVAPGVPGVVQVDFEGQGNGTLSYTNAS